MCKIFLETTTLSRCYEDRWGDCREHYTYDNQRCGFWTAGQRYRIDRSSYYFSYEPQFIWRVTPTDGYSETVSTMTYTNWTSYYNDVVYGSGECMRLPGDHSYGWDDADCSFYICSVCELDL